MTQVVQSSRDRLLSHATIQVSTASFAPERNAHIGAIRKNNASEIDSIAMLPVHTISWSLEVVTVLLSCDADCPTLDRACEGAAEEIVDLDTSFPICPIDLDVEVVSITLLVTFSPVSELGLCLFTIDVVVWWACALDCGVDLMVKVAACE